MSKRCEICGKGQVSGNAVSHSNRHTRRKWNANIQSVKIDDNGKRKGKPETDRGRDGGRRNTLSGGNAAAGDVPGCSGAEGRAQGYP